MTEPGASACGLPKETLAFRLPLHGELKIILLHTRFWILRVGIDEMASTGVQR